MLAPWKESYNLPRQHIKKQRHYFANKGMSRQGYGFSSGHVWMWKLDHKEGWVQKNWCFWTVVLEKTEIQRVHPKADRSWVFLGRTDVDAETPILGHLMRRLIWKDPDAGKDWRQEEKGTTEDEMAGWHHWLDGHGFGWTQSWWWTGRPNMLQFMELQRHDWGLNWTEWSSDFPYFLQFKSEFCNKEFMIWATVSSWSCFCWLFRASPSLAAKNIINLMMSTCRVFSCVVGRGCFLWPVCFLGKTLLDFALLHSVLKDQICLLLQVSLDSYFCIPSPIVKRASFLGVSSRRSYSSS